MPSQINKFQEALINISRVRKETDTAVLLYSAGGKDSIALLDMLAKRFNKVVCYYLYHVQGLDHIKPYILWAEKRYGNVVVKQLPHNQVNSFLKFGIWCDPVPETKEMNERDIVEYIKKVENTEFVFNGMKGTDGYMKRMRLLMYKKRNGFHENKGLVYPLALWTNDEVLQYIKANKCIQPFVYGYGKSLSQGFGIYKACFDFLMWQYPQDIKKTLKVFPYASTLLDDEQKKELGIEL